MLIGRIPAKAKGRLSSPQTGNESLPLLMKNIESYLSAAETAADSASRLPPRIASTTPATMSAEPPQNQMVTGSESSSHLPHSTGLSKGQIGVPHEWIITPAGESI